MQSRGIVVCSNTPPQLLTEVHAGVDAKENIEINVVAVELEVVLSGPLGNGWRVSVDSATAAPMR